MLLLRKFSIAVAISYIFVSSSALSNQPERVSRRTFFTTTATSASIVIGQPFSHAFAATSSTPSLNFQTSSETGMQWADAKVGTGEVLNSGAKASIDYSLSTTGARYGSKIYSTANSGAPYVWKLGDGSTIKGLEMAILGTKEIPAMRPGGVRRIVIPQSLAYESLTSSSTSDSPSNSNTGCGSGVGPIPPPGEAFEEYQRFKNIYCNPSRMYQPDVVLDVKLYGKR